MGEERCLERGLLEGMGGLGERCVIWRGGWEVWLGENMLEGLWLGDNKWCVIWREKLRGAISTCESSATSTQHPTTYLVAIHSMKKRAERRVRVRGVRARWWSNGWKVRREKWDEKRVEKWDKEWDSEIVR